MIERILLAIILLEVPIQLDKYLFYMAEYEQYGPLAGLNVSVTTICLGLLYLKWWMERTAQSGMPCLPRLRFSAPLCWYLAVATFSLVVAQVTALAFFDVALLFQSFLLFVYLHNRIRSRGDVKFVVAWLLVGLAMQGAYMLALEPTGENVEELAKLGTLQEETSRAMGTIGSPVTAGSYLALLLAPAAGVVLTSLGPGYKALSAVAFALGIPALLLTQTRGAWIATALSLTIVSFFAWHRRWLPRWAPVAIGVAALLTAVLFSDLIFARVTSDDDGSSRARPVLLKLAGQMIQDSPLLGVGAGNCAVVALEYATASPFRGEWFYTIHNKYALVWVETGIIGLLAFLWFLADTLRRSWATWQRRDRVLSPIALGIAAAICGQMFHMLVDVFNSRPQVQTLWICAALVAAMREIPQES